MGLNTISKTLLRLACVLTVAVGSLPAQTSAGFGAISGTVQDASGAVVPAAKVTVANESKGIRREIVSSGTGSFTANTLVPADGYSIKIEKQGFAVYEQKNIVVNVGGIVSLSPKLVVSGTATQVDVTVEAPIVESEKTDVSQVIGSQQIIDLPSNGRRVDSFVLLTPGVTTDGPFGLISFRGNPGGNTFLTDGNDTTNSFYNENAGRTRATNIGQDAIQEFQVVSSNFLAEYGRASGGVINTVTRSGGNNLHGTAYWLFRNRTLNATDITAQGVNPPEYRHTAGASIGGPIKKDKLFYFFNGELQRRNAPIVSSNVASYPTLLNPADGSVKAGICGAPATPAQCAAANAYLQSRVATQLVPRNMDTNILFGKLDYRPNEKNSISLSANYLDYRAPNGIQTQLSLADGSGLGNNADTNVFDRTARAEWTWVPTSSGVNTLRFGYFKDRQFDPASPSLLPAFGPVSLSVQGISNVGYASGYPRLNPSEQRFSIIDNYAWVKGSHSLKFGFDFSHVEDYVNRLANRYGTYSYGTISAFAQDFTGNTTGLRNYQAYSQAIGQPVIDVNMAEVSFYVQDQWKINPRLVVNYGVRYEWSGIPQPTQPNPNLPQTASIPTTSGNWAPRIGVAYTLNPKTVIRAGYGMFYNRYTTSTIESFMITNANYTSSFAYTTAAAIAAGGPVFPNALPTTATVTAGTSGIFYPSSSWRNPYSQQGTVAIERQIEKNTSLTVSYVWSRGLHLLQTRDANAPLPTSTLQTFPILDAGGAQTGSYSTPLYLSTRPNPAFGGLYEADSAGNSYYNGLLVQATRRYSNWLTGNLAYTWSHAIDYNQGGGGNTLFGSTFPTSVFNGDFKGEKGSSNIDQRHRLSINMVANPKFTNSTTAFARYAINNWQLSLVTVAASSQSFVPTIRVQDRPLSSTGATIATLSTSSLNGLGGSSRVPFESTSYLYNRPLYRTDARLSKMLPITEKFKTYLFFEAFNVFNHVYVNGPGALVTQQYTAIKQTAGALTGVVALVPNAAFGTVLQTQTPPDGTSARRAQVGLRFVF